MNCDLIDNLTIDLPVIDRSVLQEYFLLAGDKPEAFLVEMIDCYLDAIPSLVEFIHRSILVSDVAALRLAAHTLKSNSASVGAIALVSFCEKLEAIDKLGIIESSAEGLIRQLEMQYDETKAVFLIERQIYLAQGD
jgi:HPt (histidine-containing phosphotransfer) domain-containing protein